MVDEMFNNGQRVVSAPRALEADTSLADKVFEAWQSGAGGEQMYTLLAQAKGRDISNLTNRAVSVLTEVDDAGNHVYNERQRTAAAVALRELQIGVDNNLGKANNRERFVAAMDADNGQARAALDDFLRQGTGQETSDPVIERAAGPATADGRVPTAPVGHREETYGDRVDKIARDRYAGLTPQQRAELERREEAGGI
jgi:hypothetical protein